MSRRWRDTKCFQKWLSLAMLMSLRYKPAMCADVYPNSTTASSILFPRSSSSFMNTLCQAQKKSIFQPHHLPWSLVNFQTDGLNMQVLLHSDHKRLQHKPQGDKLSKIQEKASNTTSFRICRLSNSASKRSHKIKVHQSNM